MEVFAARHQGKASPAVVGRKDFHQNVHQTIGVQTKYFGNNLRMRRMKNIQY
jgi:hypothetical protein